MSLFSGFAKPSDGLRVILRNTLTLAIYEPEAELCIDIPLLS
jgi:hypothetical protein